MAWDISPLPYLYAESRATFYKDPVGLWRVQPSCGSCEMGCGLEMNPGDVQFGIDSACKKAQEVGSECHNALTNVDHEAGIDFPSCFEKVCQPGSGPVLDCDPCFGHCGATVPGNTKLGGGFYNTSCPAGNGLGYGPTIFHETLHHCGLGGDPEIKAPGRPSIRASRWRYVEWACFRWRHPASR